jgi:hypothetical protein
MFKWVVRKVSGRCELLRITYNEPVGASRTCKIGMISKDYSLSTKDCHTVMSLSRQFRTMSRVPAPFPQLKLKTFQRISRIGEVLQFSKTFPSKLPIIQWFLGWSSFMVSFLIRGEAWNLGPFLDTKKTSHFLLTNLKFKDALSVFSKFLS